VQPQHPGNGTLAAAISFAALPSQRPPLLDGTSVDGGAFGLRKASNLVRHHHLPITSGTQAVREIAGVGKSTRDIIDRELLRQVIRPSTSRAS